MLIAHFGAACSLVKNLAWVKRRGATAPELRNFSILILCAGPKWNSSFQFCMELVKIKFREGEVNMYIRTHVVPRRYLHCKINYFSTVFLGCETIFYVLELVSGDFAGT